MIAVLRGELPTPHSRTLAYSGPVDETSLSALAEGLASNMLVHGLRLDGAARDPSSAALLRSLRMLIYAQSITQKITMLGLPVSAATDVCELISQMQRCNTFMICSF